MDIQERNKRVEENLGLISFSLNKLGIKYNEDYFQQGVLELIRCAECYDINSSYKFSTYAVKNITLKLKEYIARDRVIKPKRTGVKGQVYAPYCDSLERKISEDDSSICLGDVIAADCSDIKQTDTYLDLELMVQKKIISKRNLEIFMQFSCYNEGQRSLAKQYNLTQAQISRIIEDTRIKIKNYLSYNN